MSLARFLRVLSSSALFFSRTDWLGDPFEGSFPRANLEPTIEAIAETIGAEDAAIPENRERFTELFLNAVRTFREKTVVNCWYASPHESAAMWALYGRDEGSVAVQTTVGRMIEAVHRARGARPLFISRVRYIDYTSDRISMSNMLLPFWTKRISFAHEHEVRALVPLSDPVDLGVEVEVDAHKLIEAVFVNPTASGWVKETVESACRAYRCEPPINHSSLADDPLL